MGVPTEEQVAITKMVKLSLENAAAKVRSGDVNVKMNADAVWSGIVPIVQSYGQPIIDSQLPPDHKLPNYIQDLIDGFGSHKDGG